MNKWIKYPENKPTKEGQHLIFAESADPEKPLKATAWWDVEKQEWGLVPYWAKAVSYYMVLPGDPEIREDI